MCVGGVVVVVSIIVQGGVIVFVPSGGRRWISLFLWCFANVIPNYFSVYCFHVGFDGVCGGLIWYSANLDSVLFVVEECCCFHCSGSCVS